MGVRPWVSVGPRDPGPFVPQAGRRDSGAVAARGHGATGCPAGVGPWRCPACPGRPHEASVGRSLVLARVPGWVCSGFLAGPSPRVWPAGRPSMLTRSFPGVPTRDPGLRPHERLQLHLPSPSGTRSPISVLWHQSRSPGPWGGRHAPSAQVTAQLSAAFSAPPLITSSWVFVMF